MTDKTGTPGPDTLAGTNGDDRLEGLGGDDKLLGLKGADVLDGGTGSDQLDGGPGADIATYVSLAGPIDAEASDGMPYNWAVDAGGDRDTLTGIEGIVGTAAGDDIMGASNAAELVRGGGGDDDIEGGIYSTQSDTIYGGAGNDSIFGGEEIISFRGTYAQFGDRYFGEGGNDRLYGLDGNDHLDGGAGNDRISGGPDQDVLVGGAGKDVFVYLNQDTGIGSGTPFGDFGADVIADFRKGQDDIALKVVKFNSETETPPSLDGFKDLDSNKNGILDAGDKYVDVAKVTFEGHKELSTVIDVSAYNQDVPGEQSLTVFGVTGLKADDFQGEVFPA